jgi:hypothetical protein
MNLCEAQSAFVETTVTSNKQARDGSIFSTDGWATRIAGIVIGCVNTKALPLQAMKALWGEEV